MTREQPERAQLLRATLSRDQPTSSDRRRLEGAGTRGDEGRARLGDAVGERELEVLGDELADVGALDVLGLLELDNAEDLIRGLEKACLEVAG